MKLNYNTFLEKYGSVEVKFVSYYKYSFTFAGEYDGKRVLVSIGGSADDIYKLSVTADEIYEVQQLDISYATVTEAGEEIDSYDSW